MDSILLLVAGCGLLMVIIGRLLILNEARQISSAWLVALRLLPLAELMFLARYWEEAKAGAFISLVGLALIMPWGGKMLWDAQREKTEMQRRSSAARGFAAGRNELRRVAEETKKYEQIMCKEKRLHDLNARLQGWYQAMQTRRAALGADEAAVAAFNAEAAAYHELLSVAREETNQLAQLRAKKVE